MAQTEEIILKTTIDTGNSAASVKSVKQELRQLTNELATLDPASQKFRDVAQRAGELRDRIEDTNATIKAFNPEAKFQAFAGVLGGVANAFSAAQGAMTIFGDKNKDIEQVIARTQGAIALATGLNGLLGMKDQFIILSNVIKTQVVAAFSTMRAAIISTGILGLVALIGTLIYNWYEEKKANEAATKALNDYGDALKKTRKEQQNLSVELLSGRTKEMAQITNETTNKILELNDKMAEIRKKAADENRELTKAELLELEAYKQQQLLINEIGEKKIADLKKQYAKEDLEKQKEREKKALELRIAAEKARTEAELALSNVKLEKARTAFEEALKLAENEDKSRESFKNKAINYAKDESKSYDDRLATLRFFREKGILTQEEFDQQEIQLELAKLQAKQMITNTVMQGLSDLANAMGANAETMKAIAIAQTTIDTYYAAQTAFLQAQKNPISIIGPAYPYIMAGAAIASGLARVAAIARTNPKGSGGGGAPSGGRGAVPSAPMIAPASNATRLTNGNEPVITRSLDVKENKVYVLEKDITKAQGTVSNIRDQATVQ